MQYYQSNIPGMEAEYEDSNFVFLLIHTYKKVLTALMVLIYFMKPIPFCVTNMF